MFHAIFFVCSLVPQDRLETLCSVSYCMVVVNKQMDYYTNFAQKPFYPLNMYCPLLSHDFWLRFY